ncbi:unnamed protein product [Cuscuta epithymum]|uniref:Reverse transcriptase domain-containing protein n=1 Tax=Cuscuta epithymum TaxID=186058 RepID=A0AAV0CW13_9ASTE|nr:unnamed protein product [Cuscuta epithymum]
MGRTTRAQSKTLEENHVAPGETNGAEASNRLLVPEGGVILELEQATADLRQQLQKNAPDARIGLDNRRRDRSENQVPPPAPAIDLQAAFAAFVQNMALNSGALASQAPLQPHAGGNVIQLPPLPPLFNNPPPGIGNAEGVMAQDTASQEAQSRDKRPMMKEKPRTSVLERLGGAPGHRGVQDRLGKQAFSRPQESGASASSAEGVPPPRSKGKALLHADDARHQINQAQSFRPNSQGVALKDPKDEIIEALLRQLEENRQAPPTASTARPDPEYADLRAQVEEMKRKLAEGSGEPLIQLRTRTPFTPRVLAAKIPHKYRGQPIKPYEGKTDPQEHYSRYQNSMMMMGASDEYLCRWFLSTLEGPAYEWFNRLPEGSIDSWQELAHRFLTQFAGRHRSKKHFSHLLNVRQQKEETLRSFLERWRQASLEVEGADDRTLMALFHTVLRNGNFSRSLITDPPRDYTKALQRGDRYAEAEEIEKDRRNTDPSQKNEGRNRPGGPPPPANREAQYNDRSRGGQTRPGGSYKNNPKAWAQPVLLEHPRTPLTHPVSVILDHAEERGLVERDSRTPLEIYAIGPDEPYCRFHRHHGHKTDDCHQLKNAIERLIQAGHLSQFIRGPPPQGPPHHQGPPPKANKWVNPNTIPLGNPQGKKREIGGLDDEGEGSHQQYKRHIHMINGGNTGGDSASQRKKWAQSLYIGEVNHMPPTKRPRTDPIFFTDADLPSGSLPHRDALVIRTEINDAIIHRTYVDTGSSVNVMYLSTFQELGLDRGSLRHINTPLSGFTGDSIDAEGVITLVVEFGDGSHRAKLEVEFVVVNLDCAHNIILGRPALEDLEAVISMRHLCLKFPTPTGVGYSRGNQKLSRACYLQLTKKVSKTEFRIDTITAKALEEEEGRPRAEPAEETEDFLLDPAKPERVLKIGAKLPEDLKTGITEALRAYSIVFAWGPEDMPGIDRRVITHRLAVDPSAKPVQHRRRPLSAERREFVKNEVSMLLSIKHIKEVKYPSWLANVVLAQKPPTFRMCVDYTDLNKACPMDPFPLPNIDQLVDETAGCEIMSFLDAFRGYHQIYMHEEDAEKTAFMTPEGIFCYLVMAFGLKNSGATYTRMVARVFQAVLGRTMEAYVDDMIVKSRKASTHADDLREIFAIMQKFNLRLNPKKCTFGVQGGRFLGYMVSRRGIEANPEKIQAIINMEPPRNVKGVQRLTGRLAALNRFLSKSAERALPFFQIMRKTAGFQWTPECQEAFDELKKYLSSPPVLSKPKVGETLYLYLGVSPSAISSVLIREEDGV